MFVWISEADPRDGSTKYMMLRTFTLYHCACALLQKRAYFSALRQKKIVEMKPMRLRTISKVTPPLRRRPS